MAWQALTFCCDFDKAVELSQRLTDAGAVSVSLSDASDEAAIEGGSGAAPLWRRTRVCGLFSAGTTLDGLVALLAGAGYSAPSVAPVPDRDWENAWRQHLEARRYGNRLWILPSFAEALPGQEICVRLDPGLAFGTGTHPTTALCLEWLDQSVPPGASVIDYGCGSGILAIAAVKLGARTVRAVDSDPQALDTARQNARNNGCGRELSFFPPQFLPRDPVDILVANIFADPLVRLRDEFAHLVRCGGSIALSGILAAQADTVLKAYDVAFELATSSAKRDWVRISGRRKGPSLK
ncbi:MAG TPA: 50S ribosomal protein L11 methyltransferase [Gammaproteobacteria bacterium]